MNEKKELKRVLGLFSCAMLVVGNMIGVGIFTTPGRIATLLPSPGWVFLAWCLGGLLAMSGALAYAELGAAYPQAGGNYVFLRESYGRLWGFLYGWTAAFITQSGTIAILAVGFTKYMGLTDPWVVQSTAIGMIIFFSLLNYIGVKVGAGVVNAITSLKIVAIVGFAAAGAILGKGSAAHFLPVWADSPGTGIGVMAGLAMAMIPVMYTYSGWNATVYVGSEVRNPERIIPLSLIVGVSITATLYLMLNAVYVYAMPLAEMKGVIAIAKNASEFFFRPGAAQVVTFFIGFSVLGCLNATLLTAPRIPYAMAQRGDLFRSFGEVHPRYQTPHRAIVLQMAWASLLALWGGLDHTHFYKLLDDYVTVPSLLMNALTVSALFYLRKTKPDLPRPYKAWGYPVLPLLFIAVVMWMVFNEAKHDLFGACAGIAMVSVGVPFFFLLKKDN